MPRPSFFPLKSIHTTYGVDFSGAKLAGRNLWLARLDDPFSPRPRLTELHNLGTLAGTDDRAPVLAHLVERIAATTHALWGMDFPFSLPVELFPEGVDFAGQLDAIAAHEGNAMTWGRECVATCQRVLGKMHVRRATDAEAKAPFDCYHYRIVHQTFHGMRDVLRPLLHTRGTAILPLHRPHNATRFLVESCPSSTLKKLGLPHQNYKQTTPGPLTRKRLAVRKVLYTHLHAHLDIPPSLQRTLSRNQGGDALDAVLAAYGAARAIRTYDPITIARHPRYPREGMIFC